MGGILVALIVGATPAAAIDWSPAPEPADATTTLDALAAVRYVLAVDGNPIASFSELQGITTTVVVVESGDPAEVPPPAGMVVLQRRQGRSLEMWSWHEAARNASPAARRSTSLVAYNSAGSPVARYHLENAWPSKIEIGPLKAGPSEVLMETVTMTCEFIQRVNV